MPDAHTWRTLNMIDLSERTTNKHKHTQFSAKTNEHIIYMSRIYRNRIANQFKYYNFNLIKYLNQETLTEWILVTRSNW